jgi:hypothetical protein
MVFLPRTPAQCRFSVERRAFRLRHIGKSFLPHLKRLLQGYGQDAALCFAGHKHVCTKQLADSLYKTPL